MIKLRRLVPAVSVVLALAAATACGGGSTTGTITSPLSEWCTDPNPSGTGGNTLLTLVKKSDQTLPPKIVAKFNSLEATEFLDDGTGGDAKAGDGIYTRAVKVATPPTEHGCNPVVESAGTTSTKSSGVGEVAEAIKIKATCSTVNCPPGCKSLLGGQCTICLTCDFEFSF